MNGGTTSKRSQSADVAVVGGGPAGIAAALAAAGAGAKTVLIDEQPAPGGQLRHRVATIEGLGWYAAELDGQPGVKLAEALAARLDGAGVEVVSGVAWGLFEDNVLGVLAGDDCYELRARSIVLATGSTDRVRPFAGWTLPGVLTARAAQIFLHIERVLPGRRFAIVGSGAQADELAADIALAGVEVVARAESTAGVRVLGREAVERVEIDGAEHQVDTVVIALGRQPDPELAIQARVEVRNDEAAGGHIPARDADLQTSQPGLYVAGDAGGIVSVAAALAEGRLAGLAAAGADESVRAEARSLLADLRGPSQPALTYHAPDDDICVCRCEQVDAAAIRQAIAEGALTLNDVKRRTRTGMGICQGIACLGTVAAMIHAQAGVPPAELAPMTARPPARAIPLARLASMEPYEP